MVSLRNEKDARVVALRQEAAKLQSGYKDETERLLSAHRAAQEGFIAREKAYQSQIGELLEQLSAMEDHGEEAETRIKMLSMEVEALAQTVNDLEAAKNQAERRSGGASDEARARIETLEKEAEQAKHRVTELERASGNKEIEITKLRRKLKAAEDDADGLNDALELKQQELELVCRVPWFKRSSRHAKLFLASIAQTEDGSPWHGGYDPSTFTRGFGQNTFGPRFGQFHHRVVLRDRVGCRCPRWTAAGQLEHPRSEVAFHQRHVWRCQADEECADRSQTVQPNGNLPAKEFVCLLCVTVEYRRYEPSLLGALFRAIC